MILFPNLWTCIEIPAEFLYRDSQKHFRTSSINPNRNLHTRCTHILRSHQDSLSTHARLSVVSASVDQHDKAQSPADGRSARAQQNSQSPVQLHENDTIARRWQAFAWHAEQSPRVSRRGSLIGGTNKRVNKRVY